MKFTETKLPGAFIIDIERHADERGFFARSWCSEQFAAHGLEPTIVQCSISYNASVRTLRGMHWQALPHQDIKVVRCTRGAIYDVLLDLRRDSSTYRQWFATELTSANCRMLYVPAGVAHGFVTIESQTEVLYQMSHRFEPTAGRGVRWDDPAFGIQWPTIPLVMSERDRAYPDYTG